MKHYLVANDTGSQFTTTLIRRDTGLAVSMDAKTAYLKFRAKNTTSVLFTITATVLDTDNGIVMFPFDTNLVGLGSGQYEGEISISDGSGTEYVYEVEYFQVRSSF